MTTPLRTIAVASSAFSENKQRLDDVELRAGVLENFAYDSLKPSARVNIAAFIASPDASVQPGDGVRLLDGSVWFLKDSGIVATLGDWICVRDPDGTLVPATRTVNGKPLTGNITLALSDVTTAGTLGTELLAKNKETGSNYALLATGGTTQTKAVELKMGLISTGAGSLSTGLNSGGITLINSTGSMTTGLSSSGLSVGSATNYGVTGMFVVDTVNSTGVSAQLVEGGGQIIAHNSTTRTIQDTTGFLYEDINNGYMYKLGLLYEAMPGVFLADANASISLAYDAVTGSILRTSSPRGQVELGSEALRLYDGTTSVAVTPASVRVGDTIMGGGVVVRRTGIAFEVEYGTSPPLGSVFHTDGTMAPVDYATLANKPDLTLKEDKSAKGAPNGYAPLGADGKVPAQYLPANSLYGGTVA